MKKAPLCAALALLLTSAGAIAQSAAPDWETGVRQFDSAYWDAYNRCDIKTMGQMNTDDLEFYHDKGGPMIGGAKFASSMQNNICGNPAVRVRREAVANTVKVFPMHDNGKLYGAVISGQHRFYNIAKGGPEKAGGQALFTHMLLLKDGAWKVSRVLSYSHGPVDADIKLTEVPQPAAAMDRLAGNYKARDGMTIVVKTSGDHLLATAGGSSFELYPLSDTSFFMKKRDIKVAFSVDAAGKGQTLVVREHDKVVAEATAQ